MADTFDPVRGWRRAQHFTLDTFRTLVDHHGQGHAAYLLGVTRSKLGFWLSGATYVPHACGALLWHFSAWGKHSDDIARENRLDTLHGLSEALRARVAWLEAELVRQARGRPQEAANDPYAADPTDPRHRMHA
jgi:hypothetical protein